MNKKKKERKNELTTPLTLKSFLSDICLIPFFFHFIYRWLLCLTFRCLFNSCVFIYLGHKKGFILKFVPIFTKIYSHSSSSNYLKLGKLWVKNCKKETLWLTKWNESENNLFIFLSLSQVYFCFIWPTLLRLKLDFFFGDD